MGYYYIMQKPAVSIIIPVWNTGDCIKDIVKSITSQKFDDFELLLVDDGSTDNTPSILKELGRNDARIRIFTKPNGGPSSARNTGLDNARGKYIQFYDSDDNISDDALSTVMNAVNSHDRDLLVSGWQIDVEGTKGIVRDYKQINPEPEIIDDNIIEYTLGSIGSGGTLYNLWNKLFKAEIIKENNLRFREDLRFGEDLIFSLQYISKIRSIQVIPDITYHYLTNSKTSVFSSSSLVPEYRLANDTAIIQFAGNNPSEEIVSLLNWVRSRWLMSYWSIVAGSKKSIAEKFKLVDEFKPNSIGLSRVKYIGLKKFCLQIVSQVSRLTNTGAFIFGWMMNLAKRTVLLIKTRIRG